MSIDSIYVLEGQLTGFAEDLDMKKLFVHLTSSYLVPVVCQSLF